MSPNKANRMTVGHALGDRSLPGSDTVKTMVSGIFAVVIMLLTVDNVFFAQGPECAALTTLKRVTLVADLASLMLCIGSINTALTVRNLLVREIKSYWTLLKAKLLLNLAILLFFGCVCIWVVALGGVTRSPFSSLLCLSPAVLLLSWSRDDVSNYDAIYRAVSARNKQLPGKRSFDCARRLVRLLGFAPLLIIGATISAGQVGVARIAIHTWFLSGDLGPLLQTDWYYRVYYTLFYLSAAVTIFGALPVDYTSWKSVKRLGRQP
jgi:hypothetical protein